MIDTLPSFESLLHCTSPEDVYLTTTKIAQCLGFDDILHANRCTKSPTHTHKIQMNGGLLLWRKHYEENEYEKIDPLVAYCAQHVIPIHWNSQQFNAPFTQKLYQDAMDFGLMGGVTFPIHGSLVKASFLSLIFSRSQGLRDGEIGGLFASGHLLACYMHESLQRLTSSQTTQKPKIKPLTAREVQCLSWAAAGKTSWEIGTILRISERTVIFHLSNSVAKIGATNRQHAIVRAITLGLINP